MSGYPSIGFALLQGLITAAVMIVPWMVIAFGGKLKVTGTDVVLILATFPALGIVTTIVFWPFEGDWVDVALGPLVPFRTLLVGGLALTLGMAITQGKRLAKRSSSEAVVRLGTAFLFGAVWGVVWGFAGWVLA